MQAKSRDTATASLPPPQTNHRPSSATVAASAFAASTVAAPCGSSVALAAAPHTRQLLIESHSFVSNVIVVTEEWREAVEEAGGKKQGRL